MREDIEKILKYGVMAPSSHNSQPWQFSVSGDQIKISPNFDRRLTVSDKDNRQLFISLGCATENILEASRGLGYKPKCSIEGKEIIISLGEKKKGNEDEVILDSIERRVTDRNPYVEDGLLKNLISFLKSKSNISLDILILDGDKKEKVASIAVRASSLAMSDFGFRSELSKYVKNNLTRSKVGMPMYGMGVPTAISFFAPFIIKFLNVNRMSQKKDELLLSKKTPYLIVITTKNDDVNSWIETGIVYEEIALEATKLGLATAMWAAPIEVDRGRKELMDELDIRYFPQALFRVGKSSMSGVKKSPRVPAHSITEYYE